jgi:hypothetical protein
MIRYSSFAPLLAVTLSLLLSPGCGPQRPSYRVLDALPAEYRVLVAANPSLEWIGRANAFGLGSNCVLLTTSEGDATGILPTKGPLRAMLFQSGTNALVGDCLSIHQRTDDGRLISVLLSVRKDRGLPVLVVGLPNGTLLKDENCDGHWDVRAVERDDGGIDVLTPSRSTTPSSLISERQEARVGGGGL